ncbi:MAG TPA: HAD family hydrolase [Candidatus Eisenbacteria bacterium]|nr:HAD family hydrolase [Candidatus Eisenbacteria bacterium]
MVSMKTPAVGCVVFDLDGTLCDTVDVDDECYRLAVAPTLGIHSEAVDWRGALHQTDSGIARWLWATHRGSQPTTDDIERIRCRFFGLLEVKRIEAPDRFASITGAAAFLESCVAAGLRVAIGTGGWRPSATLKLDTAGLPVDLLYATADEGETRVEIFSKAHAAAGGAPTLLVGDSECDAATAGELGWGFVGIGSGEKEKRLRELGAGLVVENYIGKDVRSWFDACFVRH